MTNLKTYDYGQRFDRWSKTAFADELFKTVRRCYCEANKDYLDKQIKTASEYMTDKQKEELRQKGIVI